MQVGQLLHYLNSMSTATSAEPAVAKAELLWNTSGLTLHPEAQQTRGNFGRLVYFARSVSLSVCVARSVNVIFIFFRRDSLVMKQKHKTLSQPLQQQQQQQLGRRFIYCSSPLLTAAVKEEARLVRRAWMMKTRMMIMWKEVMVKMMTRRRRWWLSVPLAQHSRAEATCKLSEPHVKKPD